jgi:cleavage and polyadenylation specificity factor subunit 4
MPGLGFIFGSSDTMDEYLGRGIFELAAHMKASASVIEAGTTIFLFNVTDRLLFGIFEALMPAIMNIEALAISKNPEASSSPYQCRFECGLASNTRPSKTRIQNLQ